MREGLKPPTGWSSLVLLTIMLLVVAWSVQAASWAEGLGILSAAVLLAVATSLLLARLPWMPSTLAHAWALVLGLLVTLALGTRLLAEYFPDQWDPSLAFMSQMGAVRDAVGGWLAAVRAGVAGGESGFVFVLATAYLMWLLAYVSVRFLVKYMSFWGAVMPAGVALLANMYYSQETPATYLGLFLLCALILASQTSVAIQEEYWRQAHIPYSPDIALDFIKDGAVVAVIVLALGWLAPAEVKSAPLSTVMSTVTGGSEGLQSQFNRMFPNINYPARGSGGAYADAMPLTGAISLGTSPIFDATVEGDFVPRYWRMAVFDSYDGVGWKRTGAETGELAPGEISGGRIALTQTIETLQPTTLQLVSAPQPVGFDIPVSASAAASGTDVLTVESAEPLPVGSVYEAQSAYSTAGADELRAAGANDPDWVRERYLQLPDSPGLDEVAAKAQEVAAGATNRYDQVDRIENWLRQYPYSENISTPPEGRDKVAWFLFEEQQGYCDYYSSSLVVMARSLGIPARIAAGYSLGEPLETNADPGVVTYRQRAYDAHSWPEVYFPGYGWVEFEPTAQDLELERGAGGAEAQATESAEEAAGPLQDDMLPDEELTPQAEQGTQPVGVPGRTSPRVPLGLLAAATIALVVGTVVARSAWERPYRGLSAAEGAYARVIRVSNWLGLGPRPSDTPFEYGDRLGEAVPEARGPMRDITSAFVRARFARQTAVPEDPSLPAAWKAVRASLLSFALRLRPSRKLRRR